MRTLQTTFPLVAMEVAGGSTAGVPEGLTVSSGGVVSPLRDPRSAAPSRAPFWWEVTHSHPPAGWSSRPVPRWRLARPETGEHLGSVSREMLLHTDSQGPHVPGEQEGRAGGASKAGHLPLLGLFRTNSSQKLSQQGDDTERGDWELGSQAHR